MPYTIHHGHVMTELKKLPGESVHCVVTSPPYWGLRDYGIPPSVWGGAVGCFHRWGSQERGRRVDILPSEESSAGRLGTDAQQTGLNDGGRFCELCGAWLGCLGLEPNPQLFVAHMVDLFREVRRVLHRTGTLWLNLGDCYITEPHGPGHTFDPKYGGRNRAEGYPANRSKQTGMKNKDLVMAPARVALALQDDGWYLRSQIPWIKRNGMPESTTDRPTSMVEYIFLFSKSEDYFYDADAVSVPQAEHERTRRLREQQHGLTTRYSIRRDDESHGQVSPGQNGVAKSVAARHALAVKGTRRRRNSDWFTESWQGLMQDSLRRPMAMIVNPQPFQLEMCTACSTVFSKPEFRKLSKDAEDKRICTCGAGDWLSHFATFPERMVTPCILAGTSERGACRHCGNPYTRIADRPGVGDWHPNGARGKDKTEPARMKMKSTINPAPSTLWEATCSHDLFPVEVEPCTVLDPFSGSATSGVVALRHGRSFIGIELSAPYIAMAERRIELAAVSS